MSMLRNLKSLFVVVDEEAAAAEAPAKKTAAKEAAPKQATPAHTARPQAEAVPGKPDQRFMEILFAAMEAANLDGFDYLEYRQSLKSLEKMPMDEPTRYKSAFAMAQTMGATPQRLEESARHYLDVLKQEEAKFDQALQAQQQRQVAAKLDRIKALEAETEAKAAEIQRLTAQIEASRTEMAGLEGEIGEATAKIASTHNDFEASYQALAGLIQRDLENVSKYLK